MELIELERKAKESGEKFNRVIRLKEELGKVSDNFDYILIDCPPSLGILTTNALAAANSVLIPVQCEYFALEGIMQLINTIMLAQRKLILIWILKVFYLQCSLILILALK